MKIKSLQLVNFKRFTDLTLQAIPANAKLVLLIGSNGSGKSSVFDAFEWINKIGRKTDIENFFPDKQKEVANTAYYKKDKNTDFNIHYVLHQRTDGVATDDDYVRTAGSRKVNGVETGDNHFYGRSAVRYTPRLERTVIGSPVKVAKDDDRPGYYIDRDNRFENDIDLLLSEIVKKVFGDLNEQTNGQIDELKSFLRRINDALARIFESGNYSQLQLINFQTPADGKPAQLIFKKGIAEVNYDLLSSGEKEIINLLINLYTRTSYFTDTIYFFDEIDAHLNTKLQYALLKEITENWIPENCQLWTASHSLGFIQYAKDYEASCIIDFDDLDFDQPQVLIPQPKDIQEIFEIAVPKDFVEQIIQGKRIVFSEGADTPYYNSLNITGKVFFKANDKLDVFQKANNLRQQGIIDRDYLSDDEVETIKHTYPYIFILPYYSIENLFYHPDNLAEYYQYKEKIFDKDIYIKKLKAERDKQKDYLLLGISGARGGYPFYKENDNAGKLKAFKKNAEAVLGLLKSDVFEEFYKVFPAKDYGTKIEERQNIAPSALISTNWFKQQIENTIK
jgi:hypothetical protein